MVCIVVTVILAWFGDNGWLVLLARKNMLMILEFRAEIPVLLMPMLVVVSVDAT